MSELNPSKIGMAVPISRQRAVELGLVEPTEAECAAIAETNARWAAWRQRQDARHEQVLARLRQMDDPLAQKLLDLHAADERGECQGCDFDGAEAERPEWPCRTVDAVAEHYGLEMQEPMP